MIFMSQFVFNSLFENSSLLKELFLLLVRQRRLAGLHGHREIL